MAKLKFSKRLELFPEYIFSVLNREIAKVEEKTGRKVLNLGPGSPDIPPSKKYLQKLKEFIEDPKAHLYPGYKAIPELAQALINWYKKRFNVDLSENEIFPLLGAKDGVSHINLALLDKGDEVLIPDPGYPAYLGNALMVEAKPVFYNLYPEEEFEKTLQDIKSKITKKTKFIWVNFPSNPTGQVVKKDDLKKLVDLCLEHNLILVYDNAYSEITFDGYKAPSILEIENAKEIAVEIASFSKTFSFAGYRMGWIVGNEKVISVLAKIKSQVDSGMFLALQKLGAYALENFDYEWYENTLSEYKRRRDIIAEKLKTLGLTFLLPKGSLYLWAKIPDKFKDSEEFSFTILHEKQVLLTPGTAFGRNGKRFVRASICVDISRIEEYFE